ncbi:unnamed protein product, partial [Rotaria magnacalcarata]
EISRGRLIRTSDGILKEVELKHGGGSRFCPWNDKDDCKYKTQLYDFNQRVLDINAYENFAQYVERFGLNTNSTILYLCTIESFDIVSRESPGIGSAGAISYNLLIQGKTQALESDVVIFMKPARKSAVTTVINNPVLDQYFKHDGLRTVLCAYAMHTVTSRWLGYTTLNNQIPLLVNDVAAHSQNLDWTNINDFENICQTAEYLGKAMAKIHCIDDVDSNDKGKNEQEYTDLIPFGTIPRHSQITIRDAIDGNDEEFIKDIVLFAMVSFVLFVIIFIRNIYQQKFFKFILK